MPTYEYECTKCGFHFERFQSMTDKPLERCPECRCKVRRLLGTGAGIIFKGSGFYSTDYRSESYRQAASKEGKSKATGSSTGDSKTNGGKPAAASTAATSASKEG
jgi:putative FmdB family regulatory protein